MSVPAPPPPGGADRAGAAGDTLSSEQREALSAAEARLRPVRRAAHVATLNGWTVGAFGVLTILFGLGSLEVLLVGAALVAVAWNELRGRDQIRSLDPAGARRLGWNQLLLLGVVAVYCIAAILRARGGDPQGATAQLEELAGLPPGWIGELTATLYTAVLVVVAGVQAFTARFHFARERMLRTYVRETPAWVREVQQMS